MSMFRKNSRPLDKCKPFSCCYDDYIDFIALSAVWVLRKFDFCASVAGSSSERRAAIDRNFTHDASFEHPLFVVKTAGGIFWIYDAWSWVTRRSVTFDTEISGNERLTNSACHDKRFGRNRPPAPSELSLSSPVILQCSASRSGQHSHVQF